jgi:putative acetyltransferase
MVSDAIALVRSQGARRVELFVEADNARGIRFYRKLGFAIEGRLPGYYRRAGDPQDVDELIMGCCFRV